MLGKAGELTQAIEREPPDDLAKAGIDIGGLRAARDVIVRRLHAAGGVRVRDVVSIKASSTSRTCPPGAGKKLAGAGGLGPGSLVLQDLRAARDIIVRIGTTAPRTPPRSPARSEALP